MDYKLCSFNRDNYNLQRIPGLIWSGQDVPNGIVVKLNPRYAFLNGVDHVPSERMPCFLPFGTIST